MDEILCNLCGHSCYLPGDCNGNSGLIEQKVMGGYDSTPGNGCGALGDMTQYTFSLCEFCLDFLFTNFVIPPKQRYVFNDEDSVEEQFVGAEQMMIKNLTYKRFKEHFYNEANKRTSARNLLSRDGLNVYMVDDE